MATTRKSHYRNCNLCEAMCGLRIDVDGDRILSITGDQHDAFSRGHICPKAPALKELHLDPDRLRQPLRRTRQGFVEVEWESALDEVAERLHGVQVRHGRDAVGAYVGNPAVHNTGVLLFGPMFLKALRTKNRFSATSVDQLPHMFASHYMFGHQLLLPIPDIDRARVFLILGANPLASNGSLMTAPDIKERLRAIQARDGRIIVVDPRRTETAELADEHLFIRPGTDAWFLLGLLHSVLEHDAKLGHLAEHTDGLHRLKDAVGRFTPERAADMTGIEASSIRSIARLLRETESAVCYGRLGTSTQKFGGLCQWLINALNLVTGHFDRLGGAMFPEPAIDPLTNAAGFGIGPGSHGRWKSRVRGLAEFGGELPASTLAEEIETEGAGRLRALVTLAGNPALSTPNGARLERALGTLDFMVSIDMYLNETTRHAHVILPVPSALERVQYDLPFHMLAVRNTAKLSMPLFERAPSERHEWEILLELTERLARLRGQRIQAAKARALRAAGPLRVLDLGLRAGPHGPRLSPPSRGLSARRLLKHPHGIDLGPLRPCLLERMPKGRRIDIAPAPFIADLDRLERDSVPPGPSTDAARFQLIGRRHLRSNNSWMHNVPKLVRGQNRCTLLMHPADRAHIGAARGGWVTIRSRVGEIRVEVEDSDAMMRGVVSLPHGFGHDRDGVRLRVARSHAGASMNDVTDELELDALSGNAVLSGFEVEVTAS